VRTIATLAAAGCCWLLLAAAGCSVPPLTGEEQAKVEALSGRLAELGEDVDVLLAPLLARLEGEEEEDGEGGEELL
jgi:hypothetical protein